MGNIYAIMKTYLKVMAQKRAIAWLLLGLLAFSLWTGTVCPSWAAEAGKVGSTTGPKVVMVIVNRVGLEDILSSKYPGISKLVSRGGLSLMTINTGGDITDVNAYLSMGAGDKLAGTALAGESFNREEPVRDGSFAYEAYKRNTGQEPGNSKILNVTIAALQRSNQIRRSMSVPGQLGAILHEAGLKTAVIGNSDLGPEDDPNRLAVLIGMDDLGRVDLGNVSRNLLVKDNSFPYGWRTDYNKVRAETEAVWDNADLLVIESGDTVRANSSSGQSLKKMVEYHRQSALLRLDSFIQYLLPKIDKNTLVMLVTPLPPAQALREGFRLSPVVIAGGSVEPGTVLYSPSTRQRGLVANYDIAATVLDHLQIKQADGIIGLPAESRQTAEAAPEAEAASLLNSLTANSLQRIGVLFYFTRYQWILYSLVFLQMVFRFFYKTEISRYLLSAVLLYPLAILLVPLTRSTNAWLTIFLSLVILGLLTYVITRVRSESGFYMAVAAATLLPVITDVLTGANLMKKAALGYDLVVGGRSYGIGNEYMGVVIGCAILGASALLESASGARKKLVLVIGLFFAALVVFFAIPTAGTNAGGAIAAAVGFAVTIHRFAGGKMNLKTLVLSLVTVGLGIGVLVTVNYLFVPDNPSHIGRAIHSLFTGDISALWQTVNRKLTANFHLLRYSPFSTVLLLQLLIWGGLYFRNDEGLKRVRSEWPWFQAGMGGLLAGAVAAFLFNDSGVIAAALMLNYLIVPLTLKVIRGRY